MKNIKTESYSRSVPYEDFLLDQLRDPALAIGYLNASLEEKDAPQIFLAAVRRVVQVHGVAFVADKAHLNRENLYRMLSKRGNPRFSSLMAVLDVLGFHFSIRPKNVG